MNFRNFGRIIFTFALFFLMPILVGAAPLGARHTSVATTKGVNVLLGGNYLEIGIHPYGAFRTDDLNGKTGLDSFHLNGQSGKRLGLYYNEHIWGEANPNTNDFTYDSEADAYFLSYKKGDTYKVFGSISSMASLADSGFTSVNVTDETTDSTTLKAKVECTTPDNVILIMDISFGVNDKFFITDIKVVNNSSSKIEDVRFSKFNWPMIDEVINHTQSSYMKVLSNPSSSKKGGEKNFAMISSRGAITHDGWFYFSDSNNARVAILDPEEGAFDYWPASDDIVNMDIRYINQIWNETTTGVPNYADDDRMSIFYPDPTDVNDWIYYDEAYIAISIKLGDINTSAEESTILYTSLDNDIHTGLKDVLSYRVSEYVKKRTDKTIEMNVKDGFEYSIDNWVTKNTTGVFTGLNPETKYTVELRKESDGSEAKEVEVTTKRSGKDAVAIELVAVTDTAVSFKAVSGYEYSKDNGVTWTADNTFTGLTPDTEYTILGRLQETYEEMYGKTTELVVKTLKHVDSALDDVDNVEIDINIIDVVPTIYFNSGALYEAVMNDADVKEAVDGGQQVRIMFDIVSITKDSSDEKHFDGKSFGFAFDVEIKLYVDNEFVKNIIDMEKAIEIKVAIPESLAKDGRKFYVVRKHETFKDEVDSHGHHTLVPDVVTWDILDDVDEDIKTLTFMNGKFSEFFVVYEDTSNTNPKTGDTILSYVLLLIVSISTLFIYKKQDLLDDVSK
ncbi:MAG: hypothetical protein IJS56_05745 [Bacilli bacterium]|nr:hypothetical protein [Bacilli bacterium]